jgi:hypothetical protein
MNNNNKIYYITQKLSKLIFPNVPKRGYYIGQYHSYMNKTYKVDGTELTVKKLKRIRLHFTRFLCGQPLLESEFDIEINSKGLPKIFEDFEQLCSGAECQRFLLTLLTTSRCLKPFKGEIIPIDFSSIVNEFTGTSKVLDPGTIRNTLKSMHVTPRKIPKFSLDNLFLVTKAGPHGPSTLTSYKSTSCFNEMNIQGLIGLTCMEGIEWLNSLIDKCRKYNYIFCPTAPMAGNKGTRRLSIVKDPECKMRVIAIFDWVSQIFLNGVAKQIYSDLKKIPSDRTFSQDPEFKHIQYSTKRPFYSIDLTAATDRFPIEFQQQILTMLYGKSVSEAWGKTMVGNEFYFPTLGDHVRYAVGQPMGARSSWAVFALSHHVLIRYAARLLGLKNFHHYILLGDDVVINHHGVAMQYLRLLKILGVDTSTSKTHISRERYEFAKRWYSVNLGEVTGFPLRGLVENFTNIHIVYMMFFDYFTLKGNTYLPKSDLLNTVSDLIISVNKRLSALKRKQYLRTKSFSLSRYILTPLLDKPEFLIKTFYSIRSNTKDIENSLSLKFDKHYKKYYKDVYGITKDWNPSNTYYSFKKVVKILWPYHLFMRYRCNLATYEELRDFLSYVTRRYHYAMPSDHKTILLEFKRLLDDAMIATCNSLASKIRDFTQDLFRRNENYYVTVRNYPDHPIFTCIMNQLTILTNVVKKIDLREISLTEVINTLVVIDPSKVLTESKGRQIKQKIIMGTIVRKFISNNKHYVSDIPSGRHGRYLIDDFLNQKRILERQLPYRYVAPPKEEWEVDYD